MIVPQREELKKAGKKIYLKNGQALGYKTSED